MDLEKARELSRVEVERIRGELGTELEFLGHCGCGCDGEKYEVGSATAVADLIEHNARLTRERDELQAELKFHVDCRLAVEAVLDVALGAEPKDGAGDGLTSDVRLLADQRDEAQMERSDAVLAVEDLTRQRDSARDWAVELEQQVARLEELVTYAAVVRPSTQGAPVKVTRGDFYEDDEPVEKVEEAFARGTPVEVNPAKQVQRSLDYIDRTYVEGFAPPAFAGMFKGDPDLSTQPAGKPCEQIHICQETYDVATGYGTLRCDLQHPHPGMHHHDPQHRIIWAACGDGCGGTR